MRLLFPQARRAYATQLALSVFVAIITGRPATAQQQPTFRENVDVIEFDVTVVNDKGTPIPGLGADKFEVKIDGKVRTVVSADLIHYTAGTTSSKTAIPSASTPSIWPAPIHVRPTVSAERTFVMVIDTATFDVVSALGVVQAARTFVERLLPDDAIGLYVFPPGAQISPTTDRKPIMAALGKVSGHWSGSGGEFGIRPSELVELSKVTTLRHDAVPRFIPGTSPPKPLEFVDTMIVALCGSDSSCHTRLYAEISGMVGEGEMQAQQSFGMLRSLIANLADLQGHKTLVLLSGGIMTSDRPGGRPDIGSLGQLVGAEAVRTNTSIYTLFVDWRYTQQNSAEERRARRTLTPPGEDSTLLSRELDLFTGASGGAFVKALSGRGEAFFDRLLSETSAYYILAVQPDTKERDGKPHELSVKVKQSGVTVRGSRWVTVPKK